MRMKQLLSKEQRLKAAFGAIHADMRDLQHDHKSLKLSTNDWIVYLDNQNRQLKQRVLELEEKMASMSASVDSNRLSMLKEL